MIFLKSTSESSSVASCAVPSEAGRRIADPDKFRAGNAPQSVPANCRSTCVEPTDGDSSWTTTSRTISKQRLTERLDILAAINILRAEGYDHEDLIREITRIFYIDLDEYNDILAARP